MKNAGKIMLVAGCLLLVGSFAKSALAGRPSLPCKPGVVFSHAFVGHEEPYSFQNGIQTENQRYFKVDGEIKPNGCTFEYTKDSNSGQCMLIVMNASPGVQATKDLDITCVVEDNTSQTLQAPVADYRRIIPVCPTKGVNGWCSNNTTDLGAKQGEFFDHMKKDNKVAFYGCIKDAYSNSEVGKIFCSAAANGDNNQSFFQLAYNKKLRSSPQRSMGEKNLGGGMGGGGLKGLFKKK